jgi:hypothetical protein
MLRRLACNGRAIEARQTGHVRVTAGINEDTPQEKKRTEKASGRGQSQRGTRARYAAIGGWRAQGVMASAGGVSWGCFSTAMLPLRRRSSLVCIGAEPLALSRCDGSQVVELAADTIQPNCRHYAVVAIIDGFCFTAYGGCNHN